MLPERIFGRYIFIFLSICIVLISGIPVYAGGGEQKFNMSYIYFGDSGVYISKVDSTDDSLDEIAPSYFDLYDDGTLQITNSMDKGFITEMHKRGIKVVPFLSNHWDREKGRKAITLRNTLALQIADAVREYDLDGVNVDIENLTEEDRDAYTDFVRILREMLPEGKTLAVAVAPNPYRANRGWQGSYDYRALAGYSDYLMIMGYDQSYQGGPPGPVASGPFVESSIIYALENVPREKVVIGIPFYGRYWKNGSSYGGYGVGLRDVDNLIDKYGGKVTYDEALQSPKAVITIKSGDKKPVVLGKALDAGTYTIWYENEKSIKYKLGLVQKYGIKGTGSWSLGQETEEVWDYYKLWLNGWDFIDVQGHWAMGNILSMAIKGLVKGVSTSYFEPGRYLTRAEGAALMVRALGLGGEAKDSGFRDTAGHWAEKEICLASQEGIVLGVGDDRFEPDRPITRQEIAVIADRVSVQEGDPINIINPFRDVSSSKNSWAYESIIKMVYRGIIKGYPSGDFKPEGAITRAEMAVMMDRLVEKGLIS